MAEENIKLTGTNLSSSLNKLFSVLSKDKKRGAQQSFTFATDRYVYVMGGKFVDEVTFVEASFNAIAEGSLPIEKGLLMVSLNDLEKKNPLKFKEFLDTGLPTGAWTTGAGNLANRIIKEGELDFKKSYNKKLNLLSNNNALITTEDKLLNTTYDTLLDYLNKSDKPKDSGNKTYGVLSQTTKVLFTFNAQFINNIGKFDRKPGQPKFITDKIQPYYNIDRVIKAPPGLTQKVNQAHFTGDATSIVEEDVNNLKSLLDSPEVSEDAKKAIREAVSLGETVLENLIAYDKLSYDPRLAQKNNVDDYVQGLGSFLRNLPPFEIAIIVSSEDGVFSERKATLDLGVFADINFVTLEAANQGWAGAYAKKFKKEWVKILEDLAQKPEILNLAVSKEGSSSFLTRLTLLALDDIFNTKNFSKQIEKPSKAKKLLALNIFSKKRRKQPNLNLLKNKVKRHKQNLDSLLRFLSRQKNPSNVSVRSPSVSRTTQDIVSLINAEIYQYVRAQMSENTLQYRTGEFARSVRVLSAQENAAVQYTYKKNPYSDVFSPGKSYLATEDRNPAKIIDAAIKRLGQDRFQKVFRTEEV